MRFTGYMRKVIGEASPAELFPFEAQHFRQAGLTPQSGMPVLEAHQLINGFNKGQETPRFVYWLEQ